MIRQVDIAQAVCDQDAMLEETEDVPTFIGRLDIEVNGLMHVAEQRALRVCMHIDGIKAGWGKGGEVALSPATKALLSHFVGAWVDGFAAGVQCQRRQP